MRAHDYVLFREILEILETLLREIFREISDGSRSSRFSDQEDRFGSL
jgi:hypothetical protein